MNRNRREFLRHGVGFAVGSTLLAVGHDVPGQVSPLLRSDLIYLSATNLATLIRQKKVSSAQVVREFLRRIEEVNPRLNAVVTVTAEKALEQAGVADQELSRGHRRGPLHGVPMTIKDSFYTAGVRSTAGTKGLEQFVPEDDATAVGRLKAAGAILLGKTNTPELTLDYETDNEVFGQTNNPYNVNKSPGGSSGGAAAIITVGGSPFDIGSDTGGSIRVPSHFCGIAGIKPTYGRMPLTGHAIAYGLGAVDCLTQIGPMARFVDDLVMLLPIIAGPDGNDPSVMPMPNRDPNLVNLRSLKVAFFTDNGIIPADDDVSEVVRSAAKTLEDAKASVEESRPEALANSFDLFNQLIAADGGQWVGKLLAKVGTAETQDYLNWKSRITPLSGGEFGQFLERLHRYRADMHLFLRNYDVLMCPPNAHSSISHDYTDQPGPQPAFSYTSAFNLTGWPAAVVRCGTSKDGMPIGVQVVAHPWREDIALAVAKFLEIQLGGWQAPGL